MAIIKKQKTAATLASPQLLKQILKRCIPFSLARSSSNFTRDLADVPKGHFAVYVGETRERFIVPISCLANEKFQKLLQHVEDEFGFQYGSGLSIPCNGALFHQVASALVSAS